MLNAYGLLHGEQPLNGFSHDPSLSGPHYPMDDNSQDEVNVAEQPIHVDVSPPSSIPDLEIDNEDIVPVPMIDGDINHPLDDLTVIDDSIESDHDSADQELLYLYDPNIRLD